MMLPIRVRRLHYLVGGVLAVLGLGLAACTAAGTGAPAASSSAGGQTGEVRLVAAEWGYQPAILQLPVGRPVTIILENKGQIEHDWGIKGLDVNIVAKVGQSVKKTFTIDKAGSFEYECTLPGHKEAGMKGMVVVGDGKAPAGAPKAGAGAQPAGQPQIAPAVASAKPLPQPKVAPTLPQRAPTLVKVEVEANEITAVLADGVTYNFWTFGGTVPGPMIRVRQGDTVDLTFKNAGDSKLTHSIDLHAVTGPGGGARVSQMAPGQQATFKFQALNPGVYVYHCATPMVAHHIANGMYGLIVVEPPQGLPRVDREFYVMQGDFYVKGSRGQKGHQEFSLDKMLDERPDFVVFKVDVPGTYIVVDHSLGRLEKGGAALLEVEGPANQTVFEGPKQ